MAPILPGWVSVESSTDGAEFEVSSDKCQGRLKICLLLSLLPITSALGFLASYTKRML